MTPDVAMTVTRDALLLVLTIVGPLLLTALISGVVIGLLQTLTQVQEQTLSFVPKLMLMGVALLFYLPAIGHALSDFMMRTSDHIIHG